MSDTPDTDQRAVPHIGFYSCSTVPAEFARKLERERDEAREGLEEETKFHHRTHLELVETQCKLLDINKERDEARKEAHRFRSLYYAKSGINKSASAFPWEDAK